MKRNNIILLSALMLLSNIGRAQTLVVSSMLTQPELSDDGKTLFVSYYVKNIGESVQKYYPIAVFTSALFPGNSSKIFNNDHISPLSGGYTYITTLDSNTIDSNVIFAEIPITDTSLHLTNNSIIIIWPTGAGFTSSIAESGDSTHIFVSYSGIDPNAAVANYLKFYPQPATNTINIFYNNPSVSIKCMELIDISGEKVNNYSFDEKSINISQISAGVYFLQVMFSDGETGTYKIIKGAN